MAQFSVVNTTRENWFEEHPKYLEIKSYGYDVCLRETMLIYLDLIEVKHWFDVELCRCDAIKNVFIVGRPLKKMSNRTSCTNCTINPIHSCRSS